jgi:hypothetical protein
MAGGIVELKYWDGWITDNSNAPHEAISGAIANAKGIVKELEKLRPKSLGNVAAQIDKQVGKAIKQYVKEAAFCVDDPGKIRFVLGSNASRVFTVADIAREVSELLQDDRLAGVTADDFKESWAKKLEHAASIIRKSKENITPT